MKNKILALLIALIILSCDQKKDNNDDLLLGLLILNNSKSNSKEDQLASVNTPLGRANAAGNAISNVVSSVATSGNSSSFSANMKSYREEKLMTMIREIYENGKDPIATKEAVKKFVVDTKVISDKKVSLSSWTNTGQNSDGETVYTYSGTVKGKEYTKKKQSLTLSNGQACEIDTYGLNPSQFNSSADKGTAVFSNGELKFKSASGTSTSKNKGTVTFNEFGTIYIDQFAYFRYIRDFIANNPNANNQAAQTCASLQQIYEVFNTFIKPATIQGTATYNSEFQSTSTSSSTSFSSSGFGKSTTNSNNLKVTQDGTTTPDLVIENLSYEYTNNVTSTTSGTSSTFSGSFTIKIAGKINGLDLNEELKINF